MFLTIVIDLNPNLFRIGPFLITWHGVFAVLGILAGARLGLWLLEKDGVDTTRGADGVAWMVVIGLIGARFLYVWENFKLFAGGQLLRVFALTGAASASGAGCSEPRSALTAGPAGRTSPSGRSSTPRVPRP